MQSGRARYRAENGCRRTGTGIPGFSMWIALVISYGLACGSFSGRDDAARIRRFSGKEWREVSLFVKGAVQVYWKVLVTGIREVLHQDPAGSVRSFPGRFFQLYMAGVRDKTAGAT